MPGASREDAPGYFDADDRDLNPTRWSRWLRSNADECAAVAADVDAVAAEDVDVADAARGHGASPRRPGVFATRHRAAHPRRVPRTVSTRRPAIRSHGVRPGRLSARRDENAPASGNVESPKTSTTGNRYDVSWRSTSPRSARRARSVASSERYRRDFAGVLRDIAEHVDSATRGLDAKTTEAPGHVRAPTEQNASAVVGACETKTFGRIGRAGDEGSDETARRRDVRRDVRDAWRAACDKADYGRSRRTRWPGVKKARG